MKSLLDELLISIPADWFLWPGLPLLIVSGCLVSLALDVWEFFRSVTRNRRS